MIEFLRRLFGSKVSASHPALEPSPAPVLPAPAPRATRQPSGRTRQRRVQIAPRPPWNGTAGDGSPITGTGYGLLDSHGNILYRDSATFSGEGCRVLAVVGVSRRMKALQDDAFAPGQPVRLVPEPRNPEDRNAIGVWDARKRVQVGYIAADDTRSVHAAMKRHQDLAAMALWEFRNQRGERSGLRILVTQPNTAVDFIEPGAESST